MADRLRTSPGEKVEARAPETAPVGETLFFRSRNVEEELGVSPVYLKFEGGNPTGTQKDRVALAQVQAAKKAGYSTVVVATCGNYGASVAHWAKRLGVEPVVVLPTSYTVKRQREIEQMGARILHGPGVYEDAVFTAKKLAVEHGWWDASPGPGTLELSLDAYAPIAFEIVKALDRVPATVGVAMSNGTTVAGIHRGFVRLKERGYTDSLPRLIGATSIHGNPILESFQKGLDRCIDLAPHEVRETEANEPLVNWHSFDGDAALKALYDSHGFAEEASDAAMKRWAKRLRDLDGLNVLDASCAPLVALEKVKAQRPMLFKGDEPHVVVLTGRRF